MIHLWHGLNLSVDMMRFKVLVNRHVNADPFHCIKVLIETMLYLKDLAETSLAKRA